MERSAPRQPHCTVGRLPSVARLFTFAALLGGAALPLAPTSGVAQSASQGGGNVVYDPALLQALHWRSVGPDRGGRVTTVTGIPSQPYTFYLGGSGGVWKTTDYGENWFPVTDGQIAVGSIGAVAVAPSNPDIVYVGTGSEAIRSNVSTGRGAYRSDDAGKTWRFIGLGDIGQTGAIVVDPRDPDRVYLAALGHAFGPNPDRGVYRSTDGGKSWQKVLFVSDSTGAVDLAIKPDDPNTIYAAMWRAERKPWTIISGAHEGGIYRTTDGGDHWTKLTNGLPQGLIGKIALAVTPAKPGRLYALIEAVGDERGVYVSDDAGTSFQHTNHDWDLLHRAWYYDRITAGPKDPDRLWVNNETSGFFLSTDGGHAFHRVRVPHGDNHGLWINPNNPQIMIQANDGGANVTLDGGHTWSTQYNQPTAELYQVFTDDRFPYRLYAAQQDNTTVMVPSLPPMDYRVDNPMQLWEPVGGCETGPAVPKPDDPDIVYNNCKGRFTVYNRRTGQEQHYYVGAVSLYGTPPELLPDRFQRTSPIEVSPFDPNVVYYGSQNLHRTSDGGLHWETISPDLTAHPPGTQGVSGQPITRDITGEEVYSVIYAIQESPLERGVIWVGSNDGPVHITRDGGKTWTDVTPKGLPPGGRVQNIEASPHRKGSAYIAVYRFLLDDFKPYIYRTDDYGQSWTLLTDGSNGIPDNYPTRVVREDPQREGLLYAGTEMGAFVSFDNGAHWQELQNGLPRVPVTDIAVHGNDLDISTMGRGFYIMYDIAALRQMDRAVATAPWHLFAPDTTYRMRYSPVGNGPADPDYPPPGARIDYNLSSQPTGPVTIDILDSGGNVIRSFSSEAAAAATQGDDDGAGVADSTAMLRAGTPRVDVRPGLHRLTWDLRYPGPWDANPRLSGRRGPMAVPGDYRVRLTVAGQSQTQPLHITEDPRVTHAGVTQADMDAQLAQNLKVRDAVDEAKQTLDRVKAALESTRSKSQRQKLETLREQLETAGPPYPLPKLIDQIEYLYGMTTRADERPGQDAYTRYDQLRKQLDAIEAGVPR
jgi:photosystem II stability/assembly factor-like uncharacterized protein